MVVRLQSTTAPPVVWSTSSTVLAARGVTLEEVDRIVDTDAEGNGMATKFRK